MNTFTRRKVYLRDNRPLTARQRRRLIKKAGRDPYAVVERDDGMGYPPNRQGFRELIGCEPTPATFGTDLYSEAARENWARGRVAAAGKSWATHMTKFSGAVVPR